MFRKSNGINATLSLYWAAINAHPMPRLLKELLIAVGIFTGLILLVVMYYFWWVLIVAGVLLFISSFFMSKKKSADNVIIIPPEQSVRRRVQSRWSN